MGKKRRQYTAEFKLEVIREYEAGKSSLELSRKHGFHPSLLNRWRKAYQENGREGLENGSAKKDQQEDRIAELERMVGRLTMENDFLKKLLEALERRGNRST